MGGATGLDYTLPLKLMDGMSLPKKGYDIMLDAIGVMETAALAAMNED